MLKKIIAAFLALLILFTGCGAKEQVGTDYDFLPVVEKSANKLLKDNPSPVCSFAGGEWTVFDVKLSGIDAPEEWYEEYYNNLCDYIKERDGVLSSTKNTEYSRVVIALSLIGKDITDVAGYDMLEHYKDISTVTKQGIPGAIYALLALDTKGYELYEDANFDRSGLIDYILEKEYPEGGWAVIGSEADADITASALQALAPYTDDPKVKAAVDRAVELLSKRQNDDGGFFAWEGINSQTTAEVIIALCSLGIDPRTDERFIKENGWVGSFLMSYYLGDGTFCHTIGKGYDAMATEACVKALLSICRSDSNESGIYRYE